MSVIERDGKRWTVADIDALERERDDYKDRWETLGRVSKRMIDKRDEQLQGAVAVVEAAEALLLRIAAHGFAERREFQPLVDAIDAYRNGGQ